MQYLLLCTAPGGTATVGHCTFRTPLQSVPTNFIPPKCAFSLKIVGSTHSRCSHGFASPTPGQHQLPRGCSFVALPALGGPGREVGGHSAQCSMQRGHQHMPIAEPGNDMYECNQGSAGPSSKERVQGGGGVARRRHGNKHASSSKAALGRCLGLARARQAGGVMK